MGIRPKEHQFAVPGGDAGDKAKDTNHQHENTYTHASVLDVCAPEVNTVSMWGCGSHFLPPTTDCGHSNFTAGLWKKRRTTPGMETSAQRQDGVS